MLLNFYIFDFALVMGVYMSKNFEIEQFVKEFATNCSKAQIKEFAKGETITTYIEKRNQLCIIISGEADLVRYDFYGHKTIISHFNELDSFGEVFYPANTNNELFVVARKKCKVLFYIYDNLSYKCRRNCPFHSTLTSHFSLLLLDNIINLNMRVELLSKRNIRDKLISYFNLLSSKTLNKTITIPFSYTDLADYLSIDRSAMMRDIKALIDSGIIEKRGNKIKLLT